MFDQIAPSPDFRYVGLTRETTRALSTWAGVASAIVGAGVLSGFSEKSPALVLACAAAGVSVYAVRALTRHEPVKRIAMAIVPWGVLIEEDAAPRVLFWSAVKRVSMQSRHGIEAGRATTLSTEVTVETENRTWSGSTSGAAPLDRLLAYYKDYADEQARPVSFDLDGAVHGEGPFEPDCEPLLSAARAYLKTTDAMNRLGLPPLSYRDAVCQTATHQTVTELRAVLRSRDPAGADPRAFAAALAAELSVSELVPELTALVQCPHPLVAAVAKQAARKLGVASQRVGALDEVRPFLANADAEQLAAWAP